MCARHRKARVRCPRLRVMRRSVAPLLGQGAIGVLSPKMSSCSLQELKIFKKKKGSLRRARQRGAYGSHSIQSCTLEVSNFFDVRLCVPLFFFVFLTCVQLRDEFVGGGDALNCRHVLAHGLIRLPAKFRNLNDGIAIATAFSLSWESGMCMTLKSFFFFINSFDTFSTRNRDFCRCDYS